MRITNGRLPCGETARAHIDKRKAGDLLAKALTVNPPDRLFADAGYDAEWVHTACREDWPADSIIKPAVHRSDGTMSGRDRSQMTPETLRDKGYGRRWLVESLMSGLKRTTDATLSARDDHSLMAEADLRVIAYALRR